MFKVTNKSGAILVIDGKSLGPKQFTIFSKIPKDLHAVAQFVSVDRHYDQATIKKIELETEKSRIGGSN